MTLICSKCGETTNFTWDLKRASIYGADDTIEIPIECIECGHQFDAKFVLRLIDIEE